MRCHLNLLALHQILLESIERSRAKRVVKDIRSVSLEKDQQCAQSHLLNKGAALELWTARV